MCEGEPGVNNKAALGLGEEPIGPVTGLVEMNKGGRVGHVQGPEVEVFEDEFVEGTLNGGESEEGFG